MSDFFSKEYWNNSFKEATENYEDNKLHKELEDTNYTLGVYRQGDGTRRYELASWDALDKPVVTSTSRDEISTFIDGTVK